jgi:RNA polymerase sigma-70 factor (ECF subfamily)
VESERFGFIIRRIDGDMRCKEVEQGAAFMDHGDEELIAQWRSGDTQAFAALVRRWQQPIARFLARLVGPLGIASDLCQEVFLRAYVAGPQYRACGTFSAWLYRIALNAARDAGRRRRHEVLPLNNIEPASTTLPPDELSEQREAEQLVAAALAELPEPIRVVLVLRHYEDMSFEDIARLTAKPASTVKSRFAAGLNRLRVRLRQLDPAPEDHRP